MGETSGMLVSDPLSTENVLGVLSKYLEVKINFSTLDNKVKDTEKAIKKIEALQHQIMATAGGSVQPGSKKVNNDDFEYIE